MSFIKNVFYLLLLGSFIAGFIILSRETIPAEQTVVKKFKYSDFLEPDTKPQQIKLD